MSDAVVLLREIEGSGVELSVAGDTLRWRAPPGAMTAEMKARLKAHKGAVIEFLARARRDSERDTEQNAADAPASGRTPDTKSKEWDPATGAAVEWFLASAPPALPFELQCGVTIAEPARYWAYIRKSIAAGPGGARARYGALQNDLRLLHELSELRRARSK